MCDKKIEGQIEVIDFTLCGSSDEEEDPMRNSTASTVMISSDLEDSSAFEYVELSLLTFYMM